MFRLSVSAGVTAPLVELAHFDLGVNAFISAVVSVLSDVMLFFGREANGSPLSGHHVDLAESDSVEGLG